MQREHLTPRADWQSQLEAVGFYFHSLGGKYWDTVYPKLRETLMKLQQPAGNWGGGNGQEQEAGDAYRTSMACLALSVPYRYLPLYQK